MYSTISVMYSLTLVMTSGRRQPRASMSSRNSASYRAACCLCSNQTLLKQGYMVHVAAWIMQAGERASHVKKVEWSCIHLIRPCSHASIVIDQDTADHDPCVFAQHGHARQQRQSMWSYAYRNKLLGKRVLLTLTAVHATHYRHTG